MFQLPDTISPAFIWKGAWKVQGNAVLDRHGFLVSIATLEGDIYISSGYLGSGQTVPHELVPEFLRRMAASGPEGVAWVERYEKDDISQIYPREINVGGCGVRQILPVGKWNGRPLQLLIDPRTDRMIIVDDDKFQVYCDLYGGNWHAIDEDSGFPD